MQSLGISKDKKDRGLNAFLALRQSRWWTWSKHFRVILGSIKGGRADTGDIIADHPEHVSEGSVDACETGANYIYVAHAV